MKKLFAQPIYNLYRNIIRHPKYRGWIIAATLLYLLSPLDISPDVFPIIGWIDDGMIATLLITEVSQFLLDRRTSIKEKQTATMSNSSSNATSVSPDGIIDVSAVSVS